MTADAGVMLGAGVVVLLLVLAVILVIGRNATRSRQRDRAAGRIVGNETVRGEGPAGMSGPAA